MNQSLENTCAVLHFSYVSFALYVIGKVYIKVPNFDFEYHMVRYQLQIENPGDVKINFNEHKGFTWLKPSDALKLDLMTDEDTCFEIVFGLHRG